MIAGAALVSAAEPIQRSSAMGGEPNYDLVVPAFNDADVEQLLASLDARLHAPESGPKSGDAKSVLWDFSHRLQTSRLSSAQETRVLKYLDDTSRARPNDRPSIELTRHVVSALTIGKRAPDIVGTDLDGAPMRLSDYRDKVVALVFTGDWCGICRSEYPYDRFLLDLYKDWPFALLAVNSDADPATAKRAYALGGLTFRSWFDGDGHGGPRGPIASAWNVEGWPVTYLMDARGIIRFVNLRHEDLLKGVRQLLVEQAQTGAEKTRRP